LLPGRRLLVLLGARQPLRSRFGVSAAAGVITGINPEYGLTTGAHTVTITGTGFAGTPSVTFGGTAATDVVVVSGTSLTCTVPAHAVGAVDVVVESSTLSGVFEYFTAATGTLVDDPDFDNNDLGGWTTGVFGSGNSIAFDATVFRTGHTKSLLCTLAADEGFSGLIIDGINNSVFKLQPGVWFQQYCRAPQATLDACWAAGQMKMMKVNDSPGSGSSYMSSLLGLQLVYNQASGDFTVAGTGHSGPKTGTLVADTWTHILVGCFRLAGNVGRVVVFEDGEKTNDDTLATIGDDGSNDKNVNVGGHYQQDVGTTVVMSIDGVSLRNGIFVA